MSNPVSGAIETLTETPARVLAMWQRPWFWVGAAAVVVLLALVVLYVATARNWALAKLTARAITSATPAAGPADGTADAPQQPQPVQIAQ